MIENKRILGIILAKGNSEGFRCKNTSNLLGKPLVSYTMKHALNSKYFDKLVVITNDKKIAKLAKECGIEVPFMEPEELTQAYASEVIIYTIDWFEKRGEFFDIVALPETTSPLRKPEDIDNAIEKFLNNYSKADSLVSLGEIHLESPYIARVIKDGFVKPFAESKGFNIHHRQEIPKSYFPYGVIYLSKIRTYKKYKQFYQPRTIPYFIERGQNYEVNDEFDFLCIETVLKKRIDERRSTKK